MDMKPKDMFEEIKIVEELMKMMEEEDLALLNRKIVSSLHKKGIRLREFKWSEYEAS